ncbi:MAG: aminotransferase class V-fold PLP-dependent enzyme [Anaerovibrio sp.]|uniref:aminotransferase class V-fold PLP-dependent enzyme n=1 Tax=Anaerovibrio sp. TaxID=1872532 RepID=UPI0025D7E076|nr:aminotransferase class V-fold PLP-dependent enzyme [Anaerovibrio sp.]MCR5175623.1 aminotransferase class V-fold PLP-dependent enzyme [Anaerovibrio sp.]
MIYLDNGATTFPKPEIVYHAVDEFARYNGVNAGRGAYKAAREANAMIKKVKNMLLSLIDAREQAEIAFTPSVTIALNMVINGLDYESGDVVYVSPYEHNAVLRPLHLLVKRRGIKVVELPLKDDLSIDLEHTAVMFQNEHPKLVCMTAVSNVTGYVLPAGEVFTMAKEYGAFTLLDGAQAVGLLKINFAKTKADALAFAGHKTLYAPFGIAGLYIKNGVDLAEFIVGGNGIKAENPAMPSYIPAKLESGSMDCVAIAGLAASLDWLKGVNPWQQEEGLTSYLLGRLSTVPDIIIYKAPDGAGNQAGVVSINIKGFRANEVAAILDYKYDIAVRAGHHCAGRIHHHLNNKAYDGTIRISFGMFNTRRDIDKLIDALKQIDRKILKNIDDEIIRGNC